MSTFDQDEASIQDSRPLELYTFTLPAQVFNLTSYHRDVNIGAGTYTAIPIARTNQEKAALGQAREIRITIPLVHPLAQALIGNGVPPITCDVTITRLQQRSNQTRQIWRGSVADCESNGVELTMRIPNGTDEAFAVRLPVAQAQRLCNHLLYDKGCQQSRDDANNLVMATVFSFANATLVVNTMSGKPDHWAKFGEVVRTADGERRSILEQVGTTLTLDMPFAILGPSDVVRVQRGCDHTVTTCRDSFNNVVHFGGHPDMPHSNPTAPDGIGVITQA